ncbi:hypothetical protein Tco_0947212 [Tanacetum coccineum]
MHIYWASVFILPTDLMLELEQLMRGFLWCQGEMKKGRAKVAWEESLWVKWIHSYKLNAQSFWEIPIRGDGSKASAWFDNWCLLGTISDIILNRDIYGAGYNRSAKDHLKRLTGIPKIPSGLDTIVDFVSPMAKMRSVRSVISNLVFSASCYFIWQERNNRLFMKKKRSQDQVINVIKSTIRLKLLSCRFKRMKHVQMLSHLWELPTSSIHG